MRNSPKNPICRGLPDTQYGAVTAPMNGTDIGEMDLSDARYGTVTALRAGVNIGGMGLPTTPRSAITAMTEARVIGRDGGIPWHYREDMKRFRARTMGCTVIMGRLTWESLGAKPLPGRRNIVISRNPVANVECYTSVVAAFEASAQEKTWIIGGRGIYAAALPHLTLLDITYIPDNIPTAGTVQFPDINWSEWHETTRTTLGAGPLVNVIYTRKTEP